jgi:hypothetical protein
LTQPLIHTLAASLLTLVAAASSRKPHRSRNRPCPATTARELRPRAARVPPLPLVGFTHAPSSQAVTSALPTCAPVAPVRRGRRRSLRRRRSSKVSCRPSLLPPVPRPTSSSITAAWRAAPCRTLAN